MPEATGVKNYALNHLNVVSSETSTNFAFAVGLCLLTGKSESTQNQSFHFPSDDAVKKIVYLSFMEIEKK